MIETNSLSTSSLAVQQGIADEVQRVADLNNWPVRWVGIDGVITDPHFDGWKQEIVTLDCIENLEAVNRIQIFASHVLVRQIVVLHEPDEKPEEDIPLLDNEKFGQVVIAVGAVFMGIVAVFMAAIVLAAALHIIGLLLVVAVGLSIVDPAYVLVLEDGSCVEVYSHY